METSATQATLGGGKVIGGQLTSKGVIRRLRDLDLCSVSDPRRSPDFPLVSVLKLAVLSLVSGGNSQRAMENRSEQLRPELQKVLGLVERVADNTIGRLLRRLCPTQLRRCLHAAIRQEHRRGRLAPLVGRRGVVAIDGKVQSTMRNFTIVSACRQVLAEAGDPRVDDLDFAPDRNETRRIFSSHFPWVQLVEPAEQPMHGLVRMHRSTLVSSDAAVCVDERAIAGSSNELGSIEITYAELLHAYRRTSLFDTVTTDAGNTSLAFASAVVDSGCNYFLAIKQPQGDIHAEALRVLENAATKPAFTHSENHGGKTVAYSVWTHSLDGQWDGGWQHARTLVRVERVSIGDSGDPAVGNRYFVTSIPVTELTASDALRICRWHWRCENENHWTADAIFSEDARQTPLSRHPVGILVASLLRMMAMNILAVLRALTRRGVKRLKPAWREATEHMLTVAFIPTLAAEGFDAVD